MADLSNPLPTPAALAEAAGPIHCEMCGQIAKNTLTGTFGILCAACVQRVGGKTLDEIAALDPVTPIRALSPSEEDAIIESAMARMRPSYAERLLARDRDKRGPKPKSEAISDGR